MMLPNMEERRPHTLGTASMNPTDPATTREPESAPILPDADLLEGVHVLIVAVQEPERVRYRRRFMLSLDAAEKAAARATMRGHRASIILARVAPVETIAGWSA